MNLEKISILEEKHSLMIRDCIFLGDILRKKKSHTISFEETLSLCALLSEEYSGKCWQDIEF